MTLGTVSTGDTRKRKNKHVAGITPGQSATQDTACRTTKEFACQATAEAAREETRKVVEEKIVDEESKKKEVEKKKEKDTLVPPTEEVPLDIPTEDIEAPTDTATTATNPKRNLETETSSQRKKKKKTNASKPQSVHNLTSDDIEHIFTQVSLLTEDMIDNALATQCQIYQKMSK